MEEENKRPTKKEILAMLNEMISKIEDLPPHVLHSYVTHYDMLSFMLIVSSLFDSTD